MAYRWKILRAAVEQEILFPSTLDFENYVDGMGRKGEPCEVFQKKENADGTVTAILRKRYNNNEFLLLQAERREE